jgi:hypothetical protein
MPELSRSSSVGRRAHDLTAASGLRTIPQPLLAFVHIEKAAGTTLIYLLRRNFALRYLDVRPLHSRSEGIFCAEDLLTCLQINPFLLSVGGHAVKPFSDLETVAPNIRYVTLLRDPVRRYLSQYHYWITVLKKEWTFEEFLDHEPSHDFQTRKLVGSSDVAAAKRVLAERFFLVGIAELFDEFLVELAQKLQPRRFDPRHRRRNVASERTQQAPDLFERFDARIRANNAGDIELYQHVVDVVLPRQRHLYEGDFGAALTALRGTGEIRERIGVRLLLDGLCRKVYYEPLTGILRRLGGLPMKGSY